MVKKYVLELYGEEHYKFRNFKTKSKGAQEAHEAIRPTHMEYSDLSQIDDEKLRPREGFNIYMEKIYKLIWKRTMASQMKPSIYDVYSTEYQFEDYNISTVSEEKYSSFFKDNEDLKPNEMNNDIYNKFMEYFQNNNNYHSKYKNMTYPGFQIVYGKTLENCKGK